MSPAPVRLQRQYEEEEHRGDGGDDAQQRYRHRPEHAVEQRASRLVGVAVPLGRTSPIAGGGRSLQAAGIVRRSIARRGWNVVVVLRHLKGVSDA